MPPDSRHAGPALPVPGEAITTLVERIRGAARDGTALCIRGGGTKDFYGGACIGEPLDTRALAGVRSYEPSELFVTVGAGTPLAELEVLLAGHGQCLPFEPPRLGPGGTVGGMVAAGLSGPARASVGAVRDYVLGATLVNGRGELLTFGGQVMKNVAGYDVSRVLAGSLGVLGVIAEVSLKVLPLAPADATLVFDCSQADALQLLNAWGGQPLPLNASRWQRDGDGDSDGRLWLRLCGAAAAVETACRHLGGERLAPSDAAAGWTACRDHTAAFFTPARGIDLWRLAVPQTAPALALDASPLVEWHGGQRWYALPPGRAEAVRAVARAAGGHATLFRAADDARRTAPFDAPSAPLLRIHAALKREFDPHGVFNRARLYPDF